MHAVSAGEVVAAVPILREIRELLPDFDLLFSVTTPAGMEMACQQARPLTDSLFFFPLDLPWVARSVVARIRPRLFVSLESELWPNLLHELKRQGAATMMVNGRITEKSYRRVLRFGSGFFRWMLSNMDRLLVQSDADADRLRSLGGKEIESRIRVVGNSKFDQQIAQLSPYEIAELKRSLGFPVDAPVFVAGSTRSADEEAVVLKAYLDMRAAAPSLCLLIAPRQVDRAAELAEAMRRLGLEPARRTEEAPPGSVRHMILDTIGELANVYAVGEFAFVGNSFAPVVKGGGQNLLQPLAHGLPVFFGPRTATIRSEVALSKQAGVGFEVHSATQLAEGGLHFLADPALRSDIGLRARQLIANQRGVSRRYAEAVAEVARGFAGAAV